MHRKSGLSSGDSLQQSTMQSIMYLSHFKELVSGRNGNTPPSITRYTISVKHNQTPNTHVQPSSISGKMFKWKSKFWYLLGPCYRNQKDHISQRFREEWYRKHTHPLWATLFSEDYVTLLGPAKINLSKKKNRFLHHLTQMSWVYKKKKVLKQNLSNHPLCLLYFPKNLFMFAYKWWFWLLL